MRLDHDPSLDPGAYAFTHRIRVRFAETDAMGIVHHSNYLLYLEEARVAYLRHLERPYTELRSEGVDHAVLEAFVQYRMPLRFDEEVDVHLVLGKVTRATFQIAYLLTVDEPDGSGGAGGRPGRATVRATVRATAGTVHGCVGPDGRPVRMPAWLAAMASDRRSA